MKITNILFTGRLVNELKTMLTAKDALKGLNLRFIAESQVTGEDMDWADGFVAFQPTEEFQFGNIKWIHSLGAGVDRYMALGSWPENVLLTRTVTSFGQKIGEYTLSHILKDLQHHDKFQRQQGEKEWTVHSPRPLHEVKVIIYGTGEIGQEVARILTFFGVEVYGVSRSGADKENFRMVMPLEDVEESILGKMDYVINTLPLTEETTNLFSHSFFEWVNQAVLINVGRGRTIDSEALLVALHSGKLKAAVLDVLEEEPLPADSPLWAHPKVNITPHISAITTPEEAVECFLETLALLKDGRELRNKVDVGKGY
ncbi:hypothetical protein AB685_06175 [Bacillus sp. LL01]|uniref:D-2-hydroxyacid dehydrogenase n=1 Tax=Bacillus sp. LL01 TaxID=1665556 RepID=UPI00064D121F|nr:D-2-hydroxyacid dehydrogenase [Bacillus sp. LL01]KMJ60392.1 hypothetical protein AB685_06175 [Bacillus sp. LL01]